MKEKPVKLGNTRRWPSAGILDHLSLAALHVELKPSFLKSSKRQNKVGRRNRKERNQTKREVTARGPQEGEIFKNALSEQKGK